MGVDIQISLNKLNYTSEAIFGEALVHNTSELSVDYIEIKLEGVASTMVWVREYQRNASGNVRNYDRTYTEEHKVLYQTTIVFPPPNVRQVASPKTQFTLTPGRHTYPFHFTIPYDNSSEMNFIKSQSTRGHFPCFLPPSLPNVQYNQNNNMRSNAGVNYYVKVVAKRKGFLKLSSRKQVPFNFTPVDMERNVDSGRLVLTKDHVFQGKVPLLVPVGEDKGGQTYRELETPKASRGSSMFSRSAGNARKELERENALHARDVEIQLQVRFKDVPGVRSGSGDNFGIYVTSRLPPQAFQLSNGESSGLGQFFLSKLEVVLTGMTSIRAAGYVDQGSNSWRLGDYEGSYRFDLANAVPSPLDPSLYEILLPRELHTPAGQRRSYPGLVPSFHMCSIRRWYTFYLTAKFKSTAEEKGKFMGMGSQNKVELGLEVRVWSGFNMDGLIQKEIPVMMIPEAMPPVQAKETIYSAHGEKSSLGVQSYAEEKSSSGALPASGREQSYDQKSFTYDQPAGFASYRGEESYPVRQSNLATFETSNHDQASAFETGRDDEDAPPPEYDATLGKIAF
ncbi:hypothetical protein BABINDRAFT_166045 [Babjeviella inositovora NRRL Y-12698]|uniref:Arrestin-like N-terminal domain-containing protein n=1 Tax=Babjeviella inositovora NRRL Y-12698 TaxID=984486 RepID=A0A1E3QUJ4_9ASCO|nr:uncharacterized protein BABINDRAFT_166045 [Babjeviella inositovora NRRL Y-12698]ODQ81363.1 hypothetical protein BABINDRAFT_166045 [Babjeviella inositovora NRRL Y-12698]